jgi:hypothetical protein
VIVVAVSRKTFSVDELRTHVNQRLANSVCSPKERIAMASVLEWVLMQTNNYHGFGYLNVISPGNNIQPPVIDDESKRRYY